jgi:hypothetical protein
MKGELFEAIVFIGVFYYLITGYALYRMTASEVVLLVLVPPCYNLARSPQQLNDMHVLSLLYVFHRLTLPFVHVWSAVTLLDGSWKTAGSPTEETESKSSRHLLKVESYFVAWMAVVGGVLGRFLGEISIPDLRYHFAIGTMTSVGGLTWWVIRRGLQ